MSEEIIDNTARRRYELVVDDATAYVTYERAPGVITFTHTIVPDALGGRGIGTRLARHVLDVARSNGDKVIPQCPFIAAFIRKHADYQDLVAA